VAILTDDPDDQVDEEVGAAIRESGIPRSEIFVTTKFWPHFAAPENVELALDQCLKGLGLDYIDLFLTHWPLAFKPVSREALENASTKRDATPSEKGMLVDSETDKVVIDWEHTSSNIASQAGEFRFF
jgi:aryl-alcohol dehydrogenase-like predicted oxidoreductase